MVKGSNMSRVGKLPINIPSNTNVRIDGNVVIVTGPKGTLSLKVRDGIDILSKDNQLIVSEAKNDPLLRASFGATRSEIANMVIGVDKGWEKGLELSGVGYRANAQGNKLTLQLGFSHPVIIEAPAQISFTVNENKVTISGIDKQVVGETAARIRRIKEPEPYKGKGIKYEGEKIRRKAGKTAKAVGSSGAGK